MKHLFIINPVAGTNKGHLAEVESTIRAHAETLGDPYEIYITTAPMDACRKIIEDAETENNLYVYACGGDGTLNECVNGAANRKNVAITHFPCGTGNDFIKAFGRENVEYFRDLKELSNGIVHQVDLIDCDGRYGINICSIGVDARVAADVHKYSKIPVIGGATGYVVSLIVNVIKGVKKHFHITIDDTVIDKKISLVCACNGMYYGGGFNPVPDAIVDDGILEILLVEPVSRLTIAQVVGKFAKGEFRKYPKIFKHFRSTGMEVKSEKEFVINIDGEAIYADKISFKLIPKGVNFIFPKKINFKESKKTE